MAKPAHSGGRSGTVLIACPDCDYLTEVIELAEDTTAKCPRCAAALYASKPRTIQRTLALALAALVLFVLANSFPFLTLSIQGRHQPMHLISAPLALWTEAGMPELAIPVVLFVVVAPLIRILTYVYVLLPLAVERIAPFTKTLLRFGEELREWAMPEVFTLGVIVSYVKLIGMASVELNESLFCFVAMMVVLSWADVVFDPESVWERIQPASPIPPSVDRRNLVGCHLCAMVVDMTDVSHDAEASCPRCGSSLHRRKPDSLARALALSMAAVILYIPANLFPAMTIVSLGQAQAATILGGVVELLDAGMAPLAFLIFFASVTVPLAKLVGLGYLIWSVRTGSRYRPRDRTRLFRVIAAVGRWSMIDVFVVAVLTALVAFGNLATIVPGFGVVAFCAVVILTMFAAISFDPRLIWDAAGTNDDRKH